MNAPWHICWSCGYARASHRVIERFKCLGCGAINDQPRRYMEIAVPSNGRDRVRLFYRLRVDDEFTTEVVEYESA